MMLWLLFLHNASRAYLHNSEPKGFIQGGLHKSSSSVGNESVHLSIAHWILLCYQPPAYKLVLSEKKKKAKITPFGIDLMKTRVLYQAAQFVVTLSALPSSGWLDFLFHQHMETMHRQQCLQHHHKGMCVHVLEHHEQMTLCHQPRHVV